MAKIKGFKLSDEQQGLGTFECIPGGTYIGQVIESSIQPTKDKKGSMQVYVWEIMKGDHKGAKIWDRVNFINENAQAVEIAQKTMASYCEAMGIKKSKFNDTAMTHGIPCEIKVGVEEDEKGKYDPSNSIKNIFKLGKKKKSDADADDGGKKDKKDKKGKKKGKDGKKPGWAKK